MAELGPVQLRSSTKPTTPPLVRQVICKLARKFNITFDQMIPTVLPDEEKCLEVIERILLGFARNDVSLEKKELWDLESDDDELEDNFRREDDCQLTRKRDHRSSAVLPDTKYVVEKRQKISPINEICEEYHQSLEKLERDPSKSTYGFQKKFAKSKSIDPDRFKKFLEIHRDQGTDQYKYEKIQDFVWEKFQEVNDSKTKC